MARTQVLGLLEELMKTVTSHAPMHTAVFSHLPGQAQPGCAQVSAEEQRRYRCFFHVVNAHSQHFEL